MAKAKKKLSAKKAYEKKKIAAAAKSKKLSLAGRDIADGMPPVKDSARKKIAAGSFEFYCRTYLPHTFNLPWSGDHRRVISKIETAVRSGGQFGYAMPRGGGKTSLAEAAEMWAASYGYRRFLVIIGSEAEAATEVLTSIKSEFTNNDLLLEDFPEICYPIRELQGIAHRCNGQLFKGKRTFIRWTSDEIVLPSIKGSKASAAIIKVVGLTGRIRGLKFKRPDGDTARPDFVMPDDPQTDESARSPSQTETRIRLIRSAILGLAGPGKKIAAVMPCTVIAPNDLADQLLDPAKHPEWNGERSKLLNSLPTNVELWEKYRQIRDDSMRAGNGGVEATQFYKANREELDRGAEASWPVRHHADEVSAIQHGMNLKFNLGDEAFFSEYQNDPLPLVKADDDALSPDAVASKFNRWPRAVIPLQAQRLTAFIDVQKNVLFWLVLATGDGFDGWVVDYGVYPDQRKDYFRLSECRYTLAKHTKTESQEAWIRAGLEQLTSLLIGRDWKRSDAVSMRVESCFVDAGWFTELVHEFCRANKNAAITKPSRGFGIGATSNPFSDYHRKPGDRIGENWRVIAGQQRVSRQVQFDSNYWKSFVSARLRAPSGERGSYSFYGDKADPHRLIADHICSEDPVKVEARKRTVVEWKLKPNRDNHWWDCLVGATVAASMQGAVLKDGITGSAKRRRYVDFGSKQVA